MVYFEISTSFPKADIYQIIDKGMVGYPLIFSRDKNIRRGRRPSWIFYGETEYQGYPTIPASIIGFIRPSP